MYGTYLRRQRHSLPLGQAIHPWQYPWGGRASWSSGHRLVGNGRPLARAHLPSDGGERILQSLRLAGFFGLVELALLFEAFSILVLREAEGLAVAIFGVVPGRTSLGGLTQVFPVGTRRVRQRSTPKS